VRGCGLWTSAKLCRALFLALPLLLATDAGAIAGDWAVAGDGCKVWNPSPAPGETIRWTGGCKDGFVEGMGVLEWQRGGATYERDEGQWRGGRQTGGGSQSWPRGRYSGQIADSMPNGSGVLIVGDARYEGAFVNGKPNGRGVLTNAAGVYDGVWQDGCFKDGNRRAAMSVSLQSCP
jgi:hypothetical protein